MIFHTLSNSSPYVAVILLIVILGWTIAVSSLGEKFNELTFTTPTMNEEPSKAVPVTATTQPAEG